MVKLSEHHIIHNAEIYESEITIERSTYPGHPAGRKKSFLYAARQKHWSLLGSRGGFVLQDKYLSYFSSRIPELGCFMPSADHYDVSATCRTHVDAVIDPTGCALVLLSCARFEAPRASPFCAFWRRGLATRAPSALG